MLTLAAVTIPAVALGRDDRAIAGIDKVCAARSDRALETTPQRFARVFGDPTTTSNAWRLTDDAVMERIAHDPNIYSEVATVWLVDGAVAVVNVESRSLEFREDASYCFRTDGSLARVTATSSGTRNIDDETRYFNVDGNLVAHASRLGLLHSGGGDKISQDVKPAKPTIFARARELPFYALLARRER